MRVAVEDGGEFGGGWIEVEGLEIVEHVEVFAGVGRVLDKDDFGFGELSARAFAVDVASDRSYRCNLLQSFKDQRSANVATVKNAVDTGEG